MSAGSIREERKVITALFADIVGSTSLGEALEPEEVKLAIGEAVARIVFAVEEFGGTIKDLAGDGVLALFGAPVVHEDDAERAVLAALRIVQEIRLYGEEIATGWGVQGFAVRVGLTTGPVVLGAIGAGRRVEYAAFGDTVNTAARLQGAAEPGTVLVGQATYRLVEDLFEWGVSRRLSVKGKAEPVSCYDVTGPRARGLKVRGVEGVQAPFMGRDAELARAGAAIDEVIAGRGGILFVLGEAGIGKSRLVQELKDRFTDASGSSSGRAVWLEGRCVSYGESLPYWPFRDLFRDWLSVGPDEPELRIRVRLRRSIERLFGDRSPEIYPYLSAMLGLSLEQEAAGRLGELSPEALQYRTFEVVGKLLERMAADGPLVVSVDDLHWADPTSIQLTQRLLAMTEGSALLLIIAQRPEREHGAWAVKEQAARELPHRTREVSLEALARQAEVAMLVALVGSGTLPKDIERRVLGHAEGNPFYLEELVRTLIDSGALVRQESGWRFDHEVALEIPETVEKVIVARIDRLQQAPHQVITAASVLGRRFGLALLEAVAGGDGDLRESLHQLERLDLLREVRRWPHAEYRFKHGLIQEAVYRTTLLARRRGLHRQAAEWLEQRYAGNEEEVAGLLAHHWSRADDEDKAVAYLTKAGDKARQEYALDEAIGHYRALLPMLERRGERRAIALVLLKLALALHTAMRFSEANETYQRAFGFWDPPEEWTGRATATLRVATSLLPDDPDPKSAIAWPNIRLCMQLFDRLVEAWPERTIVPSLAERWEVAEDGLRYVFYLREGLAWSDGTPLTAHDVEFGVKRVLDPRAPGSSVAIYFVLENGQDYYLGRNSDVDRIGVRALDERTVEFRLVAPAPYFMSVMNRPDAGPQPRHAIERDGDAWVDPDRQVVSGPFRQEERGDERVVIVRREDYRLPRPGNVARVEEVRSLVREAIEPYRRGELDVIAARYTPRMADVMPRSDADAELGPATWSVYISFDHSAPPTADVELRRALAHAVDRDALRSVMPVNMVLSTGGLVPPALQGHTTDIAPRFDPDLAREHLSLSGVTGEIAMAAYEEWEPMARCIGDSWEQVLGLRVRMRPWTLEHLIRFAGKQMLPWDLAPIAISGWLPGYPDPEYYLRLLLHSKSKTNEGRFAYPPFDRLIEEARQARSDRIRLELFHQADRMAVADRVAMIPIGYGRSMAFVKPWVKGWWEFGKSSSSFADLLVDEEAQREGSGQAEPGRERSQ